MTEDRVDRRLAAILAADIAGYSHLMGVDEEGTLRQLKAHRKALIDPKVTEHRGRVVKTTGDGMLVEFVSVVDAVRCAVDIQRGMAERNNDVPNEARIHFRIGINVGDIISDDNDIYGDGVNVAARLEALAEPGGICVSRNVHDQVRDKLGFGFEDMGEQTVKNIARPVGVHRIQISEHHAPFTGNIRSTAPKVDIAGSGRPSIAVLPFANMSNDPDQEYFADGIAEDIITALSHIRWLSVIARNSSFTYKGKNLDIKQIGRELGVRYVLEGSVRKSGSRLRITGQLIDSGTGAHLWAERFDGSIEDVFELQDQITSSVVGTIAPKLEQAEIERARSKPTESLDSYDHYLRGLWSFHKAGREDIDEALRLFLRAIELDDNFSSAYGMAAWTYCRRKMNGWAQDGAHEAAEATRLAEKAIECGKDDAIALAGGSLVVGFILADPERAAALTDRAVTLNPNLATAWHLSGWTKSAAGHYDRAVEHLERALRLSPVDPQRSAMQASIASAYFATEQYDHAASTAKTALQEQPNNYIAALVSAASNAMAGNSDAARNAVDLIRKLDADFRVQTIRQRLPFQQPELVERWEDALRKAGVPE